MIDPIKQFIGEALSVSMTSQELAEAKQSMLEHMRKDGVRNQEADRLLGRMTTPESLATAAKNISLTPEERSGVLSAILAGRPAAAAKGDDIASFAASAKGISLTPDERVSVLGSIRSQAARRDVAAPGGFPLWGMLLKLTPAMAVFVLLVGAGAGVSYAAEGAVPGDLLYPVKINVNEALMAKLAVSDEDKARLLAKQATRRLEEAETLASRSALDGDKRATLQTAFGESARSVRRQIALMAAAQNTDAASQIGTEFEASLEAHSAVMDRLAGGTEIAALKKDVEEAKDETERSRVTVEIAMSTATNEERQQSAERTVAFAAGRIAALHDIVKRGGADDGSEQHEKLSMADGQINEARGKIADGSYADGYGLLRMGIRNAEEARLLSTLKLGDGAKATLAAKNTMSSSSESAQLAEDMTGEPAGTPPADNPSSSDDSPVHAARGRLLHARELLERRRPVLKPEAVTEAVMKLDGAERTLDQADALATDDQADQARGYADAADAAVGYVETFIGEGAVNNVVPGTAVTTSSSSSSAASTQRGRPVLSPRYDKARKALKELEKLIGNSHGLLDRDATDRASADLLQAQRTLVAAQQAFDAGDDAGADALFDNVLALIKDGTGILAGAAKQAIINQGNASSSSASSQAQTSASASASAVSSSQPAAVSSSSSSSSSQDGVIKLPLVPGL